jgi:hypothetical protein
MRIGELLVSQGILDADRVRAIVERQASTGEPFGVACERLFGIDPQLVEGAWARQYASLVGSIAPRLDEIEPEAEAAVLARQAWQFRLAPLRIEDGHLVTATTLESLPRALRFATASIRRPVFFLLVTEAELVAHLVRRYPLAGMETMSVCAARSRARASA